jgi:hypothetical protein
MQINLPGDESVDTSSRNGTQIASQVAELYDGQWRVAGVAALAPSTWLPSTPIPLDEITMRWDSKPPQPIITGDEAEALATLPLRAPGHAFRRYTSAIRYISPPALFENRHSYRLTSVEWNEDSGSSELAFGLATFFDKLDVSEPLSHETAAAAMSGQLTWSHLRLRALVVDPFDLAIRTVNPGISTLTIRRNTTDGTGTFLLLRRDPTQVTNGWHYSLLPAGEFQPASIAAKSIVTDLDLWRNMVREYSEEMLGRPEHDGSVGTPLDYEVWPFFRDMTKAREAGKLRAYALGVVVDALSLNAEIATAVVIDDDVFDRLFRDLVSTNPEGDIVTSLDGSKSIRGRPVDKATLCHSRRKSLRTGAVITSTGNVWTRPGRRCRRRQRPGPALRLHLVPAALPGRVPLPHYYALSRWASTLPSHWSRTHAGTESRSAAQTCSARPSTPSWRS